MAFENLTQSIAKHPFRSAGLGLAASAAIAAAPEALALFGIKGVISAGTAFTAAKIGAGASLIGPGIAQSMH